VTRLLALRNAQLYLAGAALSLFGDTALFLAAGVWVKALTGSDSAAGLIFLLLGIPTLFAPLSGWLVDRVRRRPLLMIANVTTAAVVLLLLLVRGPQDVWLIYLVMFLYGAAYTVINSAQSALFTTMLPRHLWGENNAAMQTIGQGLYLVGPMAGAALFAWRGGAFIALLDAATFLAAAAAIGCLDVAEHEPEPAAARPGREILAGIAHIRRAVRLRQVVAAATVASLVFGFGETLIFAVVDRGLHQPPAFLGVLIGVLGLGGVAGALTATRVMGLLSEGLMAGFGLGVAAAATPALALHALSPALAGLFLFGIGLPWIIVGMNTLVQHATPPDLVGRVASAVGTVLGAAQLLAIAGGAALLTVVDYRLLVPAMAAMLGAAAVYLLTRKEQRPGRMSCQRSDARTT
jgi:MFS family permease